MTRAIWHAAQGRLLAGAACLAMGLAGFGVARAGEGDRPKTVVELFTSQGCSSCPPADALLTELARENGVVALTFNVDFWDYLGWRDTLAKPEFTKRQRAYAAGFGDRQVYTPQMIVNGAVHIVGSDFAAVTLARKSTRQNPQILSVPVSIRRQGAGYLVRAEATELGGLPAAAVLLPFEFARNVPIGRGENTGRSITYTNVVRAILPLGGYDGSAQEWVVSDAQIATFEAQSFAVLVQALAKGTKPGPVLGAALAPIAPPRKQAVLQ